MEFIDLKMQYDCLREDINDSIRKVLDSSHFIMGESVKEFEQELARYLGVKHCISCSDGTTALQLIYMAYGIGAGDAIFCPDMTFIASVEPACMLGATPVFCDIDSRTYNIDVGSLERQINMVLEEGRLNPKVIIAVDFVGNPADYIEIEKIAKKYRLILIEDAAQGMGASYKGRRCGIFGDIAATSFFPTKPLGCYGDGGAVFTNDDATNDVLRSLRVHGKGKTKYDNIRIGINSRLDTIQAAILLVKLNELSNEIDMRQKTAERYNTTLKDIVVTPHIDKDNISSYAQYIVRTESSERKKCIMQTLNSYDIPTIQYYPTPMHRLPVFQHLCHYGERFDETEKYCETAFGIPFSPYLSEENQEKIIDVIRKC